MCQLRRNFHDFVVAKMCKMFEKNLGNIFEINFGTLNHLTLPFLLQSAVDKTRPFNSQWYFLLSMKLSSLLINEAFWVRNVYLMNRRSKFCKLQKSFVYIFSTFFGRIYLYPQKLDLLWFMILFKTWNDWTILVKQIDYFLCSF